MSTEVEAEALPMAVLQEAAAILMLHAARQVSASDIRTTVHNLGLDTSPQAVARVQKIIAEAHVGVEVRGNPMAFFDDPALPEEVRYR